MEIELPNSVKKIIQMLEQNGYEAFAVGGCVRDSMLGKTPKDWDITSSAYPEQVKALFYQTIDTGLAHGTVTIMMNHVGYEVTTYRIDGEYEDGRHPKEVVFTANLIEDLKRRDFTINAMAYSDSTGIVDEFDGVGDLARHKIRCVGVPQERFGEDALRILRAVRFSAQLGFYIEDDTWKAVCEMSQTLDKISRERIQAELDKLFTSEHPDRVVLLYESGILDAVFEKHPEYTRKEAETLAGLLVDSPADHYVRWAMVISSMPYRDILKSLKFDNKTIRICEKLKSYMHQELSENMSDIRHLAVKIGPDIFGTYYLPYRRAMKNVSPELLTKVEENYERILVRGDCLSLKTLAVNGADLIQCGFEAGKEMGEMLSMLFEEVLQDESKNEKALLLNIAKEKRNQKNS